jgi:ferredoxin
LGFLAASRDMVSLDRAACDMTGVSAEKVYVFKAAEDLGLAVDSAGIHFAGDPVEPLKIKDLKPAALMHVEGPAYFRPVAGLLRSLLTTRPAVDPGLCKGCGVCLKACPAQAITQQAAQACIRIHDHACIRCYCCQELCPEGAISPQDAWGLRMIKKLRT